MPGLLGFEWEKDRDGYTIEYFDPDEVEWPKDPKTGKRQLRLKDGPSESTALIVGLWGERVWMMCKESKPRQKKQLPKTPLLIRVGESTVRYRPLDEHPALFREFAQH